MAIVKVNPFGNKYNYPNYKERNFSNPDAVTKLSKYITNSEKTPHQWISYNGIPEDVDGMNIAINGTLNFYSKNNKGQRKVDHIIISLKKTDSLSGHQLLDLSQKFSNTFFSDHQRLCAVHEDTENLHSHLMICHVNARSGRSAHISRNDTKNFRNFVNSMIKNMK